MPVFDLFRLGVITVIPVIQIKQFKASQTDCSTMAHGGSKVAVISAIGGNTLVMLAKFAGSFITGSAAMLSEGIHSFADVLNQVLLLIGVVKSEKIADEFYNYGYGAERYVWSLISAVGIFFLGCGVTVYHGVSQLLHPGHHLTSLWWALGVLVFSIIVEGIVLYMAVAAVQKAAAGRPFFDYLFNDADPAAVAVVLEDAAACLGVLIAMLTIGLSAVTGWAAWDAIGSILVGLLLGVVAVWLIVRNRMLLVGPGVPRHVREQVQRIIEQNPAVEEIVDMRTRIIDSNTYRIKADIRFDGESLARKLEERLRQEYDSIDNFDDFKRFATAYADDVVELLADEVDAIEKRIRQAVPEARHLDIEAE